MPTKCKCGGKMRPLKDNMTAFTWRCDKCHKTVRQGKRKSK